MPKEMHPAFGAKKYVKGQDDYTRLPGETDQAYIRRVTEHRKQLPANKVRVRRKHTEQEQQETLKMLQDLGIDIPDQEVRPGMMFWKLLGESSLMQIDRMFGLKELGADISGTTADTVGVLEALYTDLLPAEGGIIKPKALEEYKIGYSQKEHDAEVTESMLLLRPLISLLPLATMVSLGHHTTLECAYVLSRNEYIDYSIGYYTSLFPINWYNLKTGDTLDYALNLKYEGPSPLEQRYAAGQFPEIVAQVARDIFETLLEYEKKQENAKMMIYYGKDEGPRGAFIIEKKEEKRFRNAATLQKNIDTYLKAFYTAKETRYPSFAVLLETCGKHNLLDELADAHSWDDSDDEPERKYDADEDPIDERDKVARDTRKDLATFLDPKRKKS